MTLTAEQLAIRSRGIGSSEIAAVAGINPWRTAHDVFCEKLGLVERQADKLSTRIGNMVEELIAQLYAEETGVELDLSGTIVSPVEPWMLGTPDRLTRDGARVVEIKWVGWRIAHHWADEDDGVPDYVRSQAEWLMDLTGRPECDVAAILGGEEFRIYRLRRDERLIGALRTIGRRFWHEHVLAENAPEVDGSDSARAMLDALYPRPRPVLLPAPPEAERWATRRAVAIGEIEKWAGEKALASNKLCEMIGDAEGIEGAWGKATWRSDRRGIKSLRVKTRESKVA